MRSLTRFLTSCKYCSKRIWFWNRKIEGMHVYCFIVKRYELLDEYIRTCEVLFHIEKLPFSTEFNKQVTRKEYDKLTKRREELQNILGGKKFVIM